MYENIGEINNKEKLTFTCHVCGRIAEKASRIKDGFKIVAYDDEMVEWSDFKDEVIDLEEQYWPRSLKSPRKGELKKVKVRFPFNMEVKEEFWVLFRPALSYFNGWDEHPEEINDSAIVKCRFENIISANEVSAWINIKIQEVLLLSDICNQMSLEKENNCVEGLKAFRDKYMNEYGDWIEFSCCSQGNIGNWGLIKRHGDDKNSLVLYSEWDIHCSNIYCGNIAVTNEEISCLIELYNE